MSAAAAAASTIIHAAAVQIRAIAGDLPGTLAHVSQLAEEAAQRGAKLIALPEFFTAPIIDEPRTHQATLPPENAALDWMKRFAASHQAWIGGSMLVADNGEIYNRYHFVEPDGRVHVHDKDLPTMWEGAYYGPGRAGDDGAFDTALGGVGAAVCWELIRTQTVRRLACRIQVAITGTHWWTPPGNWGPVTALVRGLSLFQYNRYLSEQAPVEFARRLGVPVLQASHSGQFRTNYRLLPGWSYTVPHDTEYVGATQIVDARGHVLASRYADEGPGIVDARISIAAVEPVRALESRYWMPELPLFHRAYWQQQNLCACAYYRARGRAAGLAAADSHRLPV